MRIAVVSDIHSNLVALDAVLADAGPIDAVWHLGDVVGYGPEPDAVVARLQEIGALGVRGNHDAAALGGPEIDWFNPDARAAATWTAGRIGALTRAWLEALPEVAEVGEFMLVHASPREPLREYIVSEDEAADNLALLRTPYGLHGHTHVPIMFRLAGAHVRSRRPDVDEVLPLDGARLLLNPGSVGQPRDGDPRASYAIVDTEAAAISWHRVAYDIGAVQSAIRAAGLPGRLADRLAVGR
jgi:diadenosine tetraphosphatase ApaH/serine/threonine PP2A family protein phosphatase